MFSSRLRIALLVIVAVFSLRYLPQSLTQKLRLVSKVPVDSGSKVIDPLKSRVSKSIDVIDVTQFSAERIIGLQNRNRQLQSVVIKLRNDILRQKTMLRQAQLYDELEEIESYSGVAVRTISRNYNDFHDAVTVSIGSAANVNRGMGVIQGDCIVGKISTVTKQNAEVDLLISGHCKVAARILRNGKQGVLQGGVIGSNGIRCRLKYIFRNSKNEEAVRVGDRIISSGLDSSFADGIMLGVVEAVKKPDRDIFYDVVVRPDADFSVLDSLIVLVPTVIGGR